MLAAFADGRVRYLSQLGKVAIFEEGSLQVEAVAKEVVTLSQKLVNQIGSQKDKCSPPPRRRIVRITFVASDGLYVSEGSFDTLQKDPLRGPVLSKATHLLQLAVEVACK